jgi:hypothetical protein
MDLVRLYVPEKLISDPAQILKLFCGGAFSDGFARLFGSSLCPSCHYKRPDAYAEAHDARNARDQIKHDF